MCGVSALSLILNILTFLILPRAKRESDREKKIEKITKEKTFI